MAIVRRSLEGDSAKVDRDVAQCVAVLNNRLMKVKHASSITEAPTSVSISCGAGPSIALEV